MNIVLTLRSLCVSNANVILPTLFELELAVHSSKRKRNGTTRSLAPAGRASAPTPLVPGPCAVPLPPPSKPAGAGVPSRRAAAVYVACYLRRSAHRRSSRSSRVCLVHSRSDLDGPGPSCVRRLRSAGPAQQSLPLAVHRVRRGRPSAGLHHYRGVCIVAY